VVVPAHVLARDLDGELVLLNLDSEQYFGLDPVGTRMWVALTESPSVEAALDRLQAEYDVAPERLRADLDALLADLIRDGLVQRAPG